MSVSSFRQQPIENEQYNNPSYRKKFIRGISQTANGTMLCLTMITGSIMTGGLLGLAIGSRTLPDVNFLRTYVPVETTYIYDMKGKVLDNLHEEVNRERVPLKKISPEVKLAVLAIEDSHFYLHNGVNPNSIGRAFFANYQSGGVVQGASTVTMQLVRNIFLTKERAFDRKLAEVILTYRVEHTFSKDQILEMYLNTVYWGHNNYGIQTAAQSYFNKSASEINLAEAAVLAGLIQAPEEYSPFINYEKTKARQAVVLDRMAKLGWITKKEAEAAKKEPLFVGKPTSWQPSKLPYVTDAVTAELNNRFGEAAVFKGGMRVQTTVDFNFQRMAEETLKKAHEELKSRKLEKSQIALVAVDPRTHYIKAMVGGVDYKQSQLNRTIQSYRQPGSAFKPFVYYAAFATGKYNPFSVVLDTPVSYPDGDRLYSPRNYGGGFMGPMTIRDALIKSRNVPAVRIGRAVGMKNVVAAAHKVGVSSPLPAVTSLPLGAVGITPLEMANAYATFANNGLYAKPSMIVRVTDTSGNILLENIPRPQQVLDPWATASLTTVLKGVIEEGTGRAAQLTRPAAGKTGTTSDERDVWFVGYVPQLSTAVWIGNDDYTPLGEGITGGGFAAPIWKEFMSQALANEPIMYFPGASNFPRPQPPK